MKKIVVFTGAGVSADSGLATFRDSDGLWANYRIEEVCTPEALARDRAKVIGFYNMRRRELLEKQPNAGHYAIAELVRGADVLIVAGTSLAVYPAASLVRYVRPEVPVYLVDPGNPDTAWIRNPLTHIRERSAVGMPRLVRELREAEHARQAGK